MTRSVYQCNPYIPVVTAQGDGYCIAWIDYSEDHETLWKCIINSTGEFWDLPQSEVRAVRNISMKRPNKGKFNAA